MSESVAYLIVDVLAPCPGAEKETVEGSSLPATGPATWMPSGRMRILTRHSNMLPGEEAIGEVTMPRYEFMCEKCEKPFELTMTISEREKARMRCPTCKSTKVTPQLGSFMTQTSKKS